MRTNQVMGNRINGCFDQTPDRWARSSRILRSRFYHDIELIRVDLTRADQKMGVDNGAFCQSLASC